MGLVVSNNGEIHLIQWALRATAVPEALTLKLFSNDYTPVATSTSASFTEATFTGYSSKSLSRSGWNAASTDGNGDAVLEYGTTQTWSATSSQTVYGYYVVGATSGDLVWAERFDTSRPLSSGDSLSITPKIIAKSQN